MISHKVQRKIVCVERFKEPQNESEPKLDAPQSFFFFLLTFMFRVFIFIFMRGLSTQIRKSCKSLTFHLLLFPVIFQTSFWLRATKLWCFDVSCCYYGNLIGKCLTFCFNERRCRKRKHRCRTVSNVYMLSKSLRCTRILTPSDLLLWISFSENVTFICLQLLSIKFTLWKVSCV